MSKDKQHKMALRRDAGYRRPREVKEKIRGPEYAMSFACFECKTAHKRHFDSSPCDYPRSMACPVRNSKMVNLGRHFKAPKKSDEAQWKKVKFLVDHGFVFQHIYELREDGGHYKVEYPKTLSEAHEFIVKYEEQAWHESL